MWVQAQGEYMLLKIDNAAAVGNRIISRVVSKEGTVGNPPLGWYETEERCIEVFKELRRAIGRGDKIYVIPEE